MFTVQSIHLGSGGKHIFVLVRQQPYIQNRKCIPTYKINTLTYAFHFWQFVVQAKVAASDFTKGNIFVEELDVKYLPQSICL